MTADTFRCADASEARAEPMYGTASHVQRWLLVEQPGAWGYDALTHSRFPSQAAMQLRQRARVAGVRVVLIRRGHGFKGDGRRCYFARTTPQRTDLQMIEVRDPSDLLDIDLQRFTTPGATVHPEPLVLVCTHGKHDACCSIRGNQVSRVACALPDVDAWECAHIGGDRFAANVLLFPHGIYCGRVTPSGVTSLIDRYRGGHIDLDHWRGRSAYPFPIQAAEYYVRRELGLSGVDDVQLARSSSDAGLIDVSFDTSEGLVDLTIAVERDMEPHQLTCGARSPKLVPRYELRSLRSAAERAR